MCGAWMRGQLVPEPHPAFIVTAPNHRPPAVVSTLGSCSCYCVSWAVGQPLAHALWPDRLDRYAAEVAGAPGCAGLRCTDCHAGPIGWRRAWLGSFLLALQLHPTPA